MLHVERPSRRTLDALAWASGCLYALGLVLFVIGVLASTLTLLWPVIGLVLAGLVLSLPVEFGARKRRKRTGGTDATRSHVA